MTESLLLARDGVKIVAYVMCWCTKLVGRFAESSGDAANLGCRSTSLIDLRFGIKTHVRIRKKDGFYIALCGDRPQIGTRGCNPLSESLVSIPRLQLIVQVGRFAESSGDAANLVVGRGVSLTHNLGSKHI